MKQITLKELNQTMTASSTAMHEADQVFVETLRHIAADIRENAVKRPIILLSGPSGSGKTTTAYLIERFLDSWGVETHTISMDHFFRTLTPKQRAQAAEGVLDLESPSRVDVPYLNQQLRKIIAGVPTWMPRYHFPTTTRWDRDWCLERKPGELLLLEGIHALNPEVITIPEEMTVRLYVSVQTSVTDGEAALPPSCLRLIRRMIRDRNFRHRSFEETLSMLPHVQNGEHRYISPYQARATFSIDTFLPYELGIYKSLLDEELRACMPHEVLQPLEQMWSHVIPLPLEQVSSDSLVREFVGESIFQY